MKRISLKPIASTLVKSAAVIGNLAGFAAVYGQAIGPSTLQTPYVVPVAPGVQTISIISNGPSGLALPASFVGDEIYPQTGGGTYRLVGIPDGLGAFDNGDGTITLLVNHELGSGGIVRSHGSARAFVSEWVINSSTLSVVGGKDLIKDATSIFTWNPGSSTYNPGGTLLMSRLCSADLPVLSAFFNANSGLGTNARIFMNGEESGTEGKAFGHIVTGASAGTTYELPALGKFAWENSVASPFAQDKTIVIGTDDGQNGQVYVYIGNKTNTGTDVERAGLTNGSLYGIKVNGLADESRTNALSTSTPTYTAAFTLFNHGDIRNTTGAALDASSEANGVTTFLRPEDGHWDPAHPSDFYFVTTDQYDTVKSGQGAQAGRSRLWRMRFNSITDPTSGGTIEALLDGSETQQMMDNITVVNGADGHTRVVIEEDIGGQQASGKIWLYDTADDSLLLVAKHDPARFGDRVGNVNTAPTSPFSIDEEASGIIDASAILGPGWFIFDTQAHYGISGELVEGGQIQAIFIPQAVPEPASLALLALGGAFLIGRPKRKQS